MTTEPTPAWHASMQQLEEVQRAAELLALLQQAQRIGLLRLLTTPTRVVDVQRRLGGVPTPRLEAALGLLEAHGIVEQSPGGWVLVDGWAPMVSGESPVPFEAALGFGKVRTDQFADCLSGGLDYAGLGQADRLQVALGVSPNPESDQTVATARHDLHTLPSVVRALDQGGRAIELGCGVGSRMCALARAFPTATFVGVERHEELAAAGRRRAHQMGVAERVRFDVYDAVGYQPDALCDLVTWSQFFFPDASRNGALETARRALKPGGWITMPVIWDGITPAQGSPEHQDLAAERLLMDLWQVPLRNTQQMVEELSIAGFINIRIDPTPMVHFVRGQIQ